MVDGIGVFLLYTIYSIFIETYNSYEKFYFELMLNQLFLKFNIFWLIVKKNALFNHVKCIIFRLLNMSCNNKIVEWNKCYLDWNLHVNEKMRVYLLNDKL